MAESIQEKRKARRKRREEGGDELENTGITEGKGRATPSRRKGEITGAGVTVQDGNALTRFFGRIIEYFAGVRSELEKVTWPTREETNRLTRIVLLVTLASALFLGGLSILFTEIFNLGVVRPWIFILVFVAFIGLLLAYARFVGQNETPDY
jgi:preprotein translocase subunit SecE